MTSSSTSSSTHKDTTHKDPTHKDRVLATLRLSPQPLTVPQLAEKCQCSDVSVRRALRDLIDGNLVRFVGNLPRYDARQHLAWGRGYGQYAATPERAIAV